MSAQGFEEQARKVIRELFGRYPKVDLLYKWSTGNKSNAGVHAAIDNKGSTWHIIFTPEGMFGGFTKRPWASAGGFQADTESFIWSHRDGTTRKYVATGNANHLHFNPDRIAFGHPHAIFLNLDNLPASRINPDAARFAGFSNAADLNPATAPFSVVEYLVFHVSEEDEYIDRVNLGIDWTAAGRDSLLKQVKSFKAFAPSVTGCEDHKLNVITLGPRGAGKTSYGNGTFSSLRGRLTEILHAAPAAGDVTTKQRNISMQPFVNMGYCDVPGWTSVKNWPTYLRLLRCIVLGKTRDEESLLPITEDLLADIEARPAAPYDKQIHCMIVLRPVEDDRPVFVEKLKSIVQEFDVRVPVVVGLTKVDRVLPATATLKNVYALDDVLAARETLARQVGLDANRIMPLATYGGGIAHPNVEVEILVLSILKKAQALAEKALETHGRFLMRQRQRQGPATTAGQASVPPPGSQPPSPNA